MEPQSVGLLAGQIWEFLREKNELTEIALKVALKKSHSEIYTALGWLLREDKIVLRREGNELIVSLR